LGEEEKQVPFGALSKNMFAAFYPDTSGIRVSIRRDIDTP
jgi:hypothetical protein